MADVNWSGVDNFAEMLQIPNQTTGNLFWAVMTYMIFVILTIVMIGYGLEIALLSAGFACLLLAMYLAYAGLVGWATVGVFVGIEIFLLIYIYVTSNRT